MQHVRCSLPGSVPFVRRRASWKRTLAALAVVLGTFAPAGWIGAAEPAPPGRGVVDFAVDVLPALQKNCVACHNAQVNEAGVALDSPDRIRQGGENGPLVVPGKGAESRLYRVAAHERDPVMPPADNKVGAARLNAQQLSLLKAWIDQGAKGSTATSVRIERRPLAKSFKPILALAVSRDDELLACGRGANLHVYDLRGPRFVDELSDPSLPIFDGVGTADSDLVRSVAFDRTGNWLASGGYRAVRIWKRPQPEAAVQFARGSDPRVFGMLPGGASMVIGYESGAVVLVDKDGTSQRAFVEKGAAVRGLGISDDGRKLIVAAADKSLRIWNVADGGSLGAWTLPAEPRSLVLLSGDPADAASERIAVGSVDGTVRLWNLAGVVEAAGKELPAARLELKGHNQAVVTLAAARHLKDRLWSGGDDGLAKLWNTADGALVRNYGQESPVTSIAVRSDGQRLVTVGPKSVRLWNATDGNLITEIKQDWRAARKIVQADGASFHAKECVAYRKRDLQECEEGLKREMGVVEGAMKAKEMAEKAVTEKTEAARKALEARTAAEKTAAEVATAFRASQEKRTGSQAALADSDVAVKRAAAESERAKSAADKNKDDKDLAAAAVKAEQDLAVARTARQTAEKALAEATEAFRAAEKKKQEADRQASEAREKSKTPERELKDAQNMLVGATNFIATAAAILEKAKAAVPAAKEAVTVAEARAAKADVDKKTLVDSLASSAKPFRLAAYSPDGRLFAIAGEADATLLYDGDRGAPFEVAMPAPTLRPSPTAFIHPIGALGFAEDGRLITADGIGHFTFWNVGTRWTLHRTLVNTTDKGVPVDRVLSLAFSHDGRWLATAGGRPAVDGEVVLWDLARGTPHRRIGLPHRDTVTCVRFSPDGSLLATSCSDKMVRLFRVENGELFQEIAGHTQPVLGVSWSSDGRSLVSGGSDQTLKLWNPITWAAQRTYRGTAYRIGEYRRAVTSLSFVGETEHFVASSGDGTVRLHRIGNEYDVRAFREAKSYFHATAGTSDGKLVFGGGQDGTLHAWHGESGYKAWSATAAPGEVVKPKE